MIRKPVARPTVGARVPALASIRPDRGITGSRLREPMSGKRPPRTPLAVASLRDHHSPGGGQLPRARRHQRAACARRGARAAGGLCVVRRVDVRRRGAPSPRRHHRHPDAPYPDRRSIRAANAVRRAIRIRGGGAEPVRGAGVCTEALRAGVGPTSSRNGSPISTNSAQRFDALPRAVRSSIRR